MINYAILKNTLIPSIILMCLSGCVSSESKVSDNSSLIESDSWKKTFDIGACNMLTVGSNTYFLLKPGHKIVLEGNGTKSEMLVTDKTKIVDGVNTRVVLETSWEDGELHEIAANYMAICEKTKDVYYFGEEVDYYKKGKVISHDGSWLAGEDGSKAGMLMPGDITKTKKFYIEYVPGIALERAEIVSDTEICKTPAGIFSKCLKVREDKPLDANTEEFKYYAPGIGLVQDEELVLTHYSH